LGGKTGLTDLAGGNLGILFDAGMGRPVAIVVLGATEKSRFTDVSALLFRTQEYFAETTLYQ
jgi:D-alanyl-D-alanine carboxypeptidase